MFTYSTKGTCSRQILFDVDAENKLHNVRFIGGCGGNLQGIARLVEGKDIDDIQALLCGIRCRNGTSMPRSAFPRRSPNIKRKEKTPRPKNSPTAFFVF